jgi:hypothetical protein
MRSLRSIVIIGVAAAFLPLAPAFGQWTQADREEFRVGCQNSCVKGDTSKATPCDTYCRCMTGELEKAYPDARDLVKANQTQDPVFTQRMGTFARSCNPR